jgi:hypothetical protein
MAEEMTNTTNTVENSAENTENSTNAENQEGIKTYTQEEVLKLLQAEGDRRVTEALKTQQKKFDKQLSLAKLDGEEREKALKDARIAELEEMLAQKTIAENKSELKSVLASRGLSAEFADIITVTDDLETSQANIDKLDKLFKAAVKTEVEKRLAGNTPKGNGAATATELTAEKAKKLSLAEMEELKAKNPELFNKLFN